MKKITTKKNKVSVKKVIAVGAGIAAVGAGAYYLLGPKSKEHQKKAKKLATDIKTEVSKKIKDLKRVTKPLYHNTIDVLTKTYHKQYKEHKGEITAIAKELKDEWKSIQGKVPAVVKKVKKAVKKIK